MSNTFYFTSESVGEGHPDKLCDQISDSVLDACLSQDEKSRVSCSVCAKAGMVMVLGSVCTAARLDVQRVVREAIKSVGYDDGGKGLDYQSCGVVWSVEEYRNNDGGREKMQHSDNDDQGNVFGYATDETQSMMPLSHVLATALVQRLAKVRKENIITWLRPDCKSQVTLEYRKEGGMVIPIRVHTIVISAQHEPQVTNDTIRRDLLEHVIKPVVPPALLDAGTVYHLNPSGRFVIGGPTGDAGLTGRKVIVDCYGGWGAHGGAAFSGRDPAAHGRAAAYAARWAAKSLVAEGLAHRCIIQLSYVVGVEKPISIFVDTYGTGKKTDSEILKIIENNFDFRPSSIIKELNLLRPIYKKTAVFGHFGRDDPDFTWEIPKKLNLK
eukprot:TRINITY_DN1702_c0_g1_i1.p1 TRINITY_DN1702_c0_g1~~TRINITY_DN1702_c0_g1_i1.p1  ORF type:complete len:382 (+),score=77.43 TRINITY_DN1702_c0_g1_i1:46-1191(+)